MNTSNNRPTVAVLGIGMMGFPMARRLCEAGFTVHAWNRSRNKAERLQPFGAHVADTPAQGRGVGRPRDHPAGERRDC